MWMPLRSVKMNFFIAGPSAGLVSEVDARLESDFMLTGAANIPPASEMRHPHLRRRSPRERRPPSRFDKLQAG
jgi:hypothetical protein